MATAKTESVTVRMNPATRKALKAYADRVGLKLYAIIEQAILQYLKGK